MQKTISKILSYLPQQLRQVSETPSLDAQVLLAHHLNKPRTWILAHPEFRVNINQYDLIIQSLHRLQSGEPLPYIIGHWEFYGLDFLLNSHVLIPRPETELLVERAINWLQRHPHKRRVVDVGTGSGCIAISLAKHIPDVRVILTDLSDQVLEVARMNAEKHGLADSMDFYQTDLLQGIPGPFDLICANLPYIPTAELQELPVSRSEPLVALDGGQGGILLIQRLLEEAFGKLISGGLILLEIEASQGDAVKTIAHSIFPYSNLDILKDLSAHDRCLEIERPGLIVHLCQQQEWIDRDQYGEFHSKSLEQEGFIHCSQPEQIIQVANHYYQGFPEMTLLWIDPQKITSKIHWEGTTGQLFPHVYGPINLDAVVTVTRLNPDADGTFRHLELPRRVNPGS